MPCHLSFEPALGRWVPCTDVNESLLGIRAHR